MGKGVDTMTNRMIMPVSFLFKRKPDDLEIIGVSNLFLTQEEYDTLTDEIALKLLREQGYNVIRLIHKDENIISVRFGDLDKR